MGNETLELITLKCPPGTRQKMNTLAYARGKSPSELLIEMLDIGINRHMVDPNCIHPVAARHNLWCLRCGGSLR